MRLDVNVLVAASRGDHPHHAVGRARLEQAAVGAAAGSALTLMPMVLTKTPIQALQTWRTQKHQLFVKRVYQKAGT